MKKIRVNILTGLFIGLFLSAAGAATPQLSLLVGQTDRIPVKNIARFLVTNPEILKAEKSADQLEITALKGGTSYLHIWDNLGRRTFKITNTYRSSSETSLTESAPAVSYEPVKAGYKFGTGTGNSTSTYAQNQWGYNYSYNQLFTSGDTPIGKSKTLLQFETREQMGEITYLLQEVKTDDYVLSFGNNYANYSDLTIPYTNYEGFTFSSELFETLDYSIIRGAKGYGIWGNQVKADLRTPEYFSSLRTTYNHAPSSSKLHLTYLGLDQTATQNQNSILGLEASTKIGNLLTLGGEYARGQTAAAQKINTAIRFKNFSLEGIYRQIDQNYTTVYDMISWRGADGYFLSSQLTPLSFLRLSATYDNYIMRQYSNLPNLDQGINLTLAPSEPFPRLMLSSWQRDRRGFGAAAGIQSGVNLQITQPLELSPAVKFETYARLGTDNYNNSDLQKFGLGSKLYFSEAFNLNLYQENNSSLAGSGKVTQLNANYQRQIFESPFYASFSGGLQNFEGITTSLPKQLITYLINLEYKPADNLGAFLKGTFTDIQGETALEIDRNQKDIHLGISYVWNTGLILKPSGTVRGIVFLDKNGNGIRDKDEPGLNQAQILIGEKSAYTNSRGEYNLDGIPAERVRVKLNLKSVPPNYITTAANPDPVVVKAGRDNTVDFGIITNSSIQGKVFLDENGNGKLDTGENGLPNLKLIVNDSEIYTDGQGSYTARNLKPDRIYLKLDAASLPFGYSTARNPEQALRVPENQSLEINFPVYQLKAVSGKVYLDKNKKALGGVAVKLDSSVTLTDAQGRYLFKSIKPGTHKISITLPKEQGAKSFSQIVKLNGQNKQASVNFIL